MSTFRTFVGLTAFLSLSGIVHAGGPARAPAPARVEAPYKQQRIIRNLLESRFSGIVNGWASASSVKIYPLQGKNRFKAEGMLLLHPRRGHVDIDESLTMKDPLPDNLKRLKTTAAKMHVAMSDAVLTEALTTNYGDERPLAKESLEKIVRRALDNQVTRLTGAVKPPTAADRKTLTKDDIEFIF